MIDKQMGSYPSECVVKFVNLALNCCQDETDDRPSMVTVVRELENIWLMMPETSTNLTESSVSEDEKVGPLSPLFLSPPPSSSSMSSMKSLFLSEDISSSDLISGVTPTFEPR